jgi:hypothetical protein
MEASNPRQELLEELRAYIVREIRGGYARPEEIAEAAVEAVQEDEAAGNHLRPHADRLVAEVLAEAREEQKSWPKVTDCDRLDQAFATLETGGIIARQNFACCQSCGHSEIWDEVKAATEGGRSVLGYTFFHQQDTEGAAEGGGLYLAYGATEHGEAAAVAVGQVIVNALSGCGLEVVWDGSFKKRIFVKLEWRRRAPDPVFH